MSKIMKFCLCVSFYFASNVANAAPIQIIKTKILSEITYSISECDKVVAEGIVISDCERTFTLENPVLQFQDSHDLDSIEVNLISDINLEAGIWGQDPDWQSREPLDLSDPENLFRLVADGGDALTTLLSYDGEACVGTFVDCRIDANWTYNLGFEYAISSAGFNVSSQLLKLQGQINCEDSDPIGIVGFGTCGGYVNKDAEDIAGLGRIFSSQAAIADFLSTPVEMKVNQSVFSLLSDATDDLFDIQLNVIPYFEFNVVYNYVDKSTLIIDEPDVSTVPLPAGLPLLIAGLACLGVVGRTGKKARNDHSH